jgi:hypothetical protein
MLPAGVVRGKLERSCLVMPRCFPSLPGKQFGTIAFRSSSRDHRKRSIRLPTPAFRVILERIPSERVLTVPSGFPYGLPESFWNARPSDGWWWNVSDGHAEVGQRRAFQNVSRTRGNTKGRRSSLVEPDDAGDERGVIPRSMKSRICMSRSLLAMTSAVARLESRVLPV